MKDNITITLTQSEAEQIFTLINDNQREGSYCGRKDYWDKRNEKILKKLENRKKKRYYWCEIDLKTGEIYADKGRTILEDKPDWFTYFIVNEKMEGDITACSIKSLEHAKELALEQYKNYLENPELLESEVQYGTSSI